MFLSSIKNNSTNVVSSNILSTPEPCPETECLGVYSQSEMMQHLKDHHHKDPKLSGFLLLQNVWQNYSIKCFRNSCIKCRHDA